MLPAATRDGPEDGPSQLRTAGAHETEEAHDLACRDGQVDVNETRAAQAA